MTRVETSSFFKLDSSKVPKVLTAQLLVLMWLIILCPQPACSRRTSRLCLSPFTLCRWPTARFDRLLVINIRPLQQTKPAEESLQWAFKARHTGSDDAAFASARGHKPDYLYRGTEAADLRKLRFEIGHD